MNIVITNDDGWGSKGIRLLAREMLQFGRVYVVAPNGARSGMSNAITVDSPMTLDRIEDEEFVGDPIDIYITNANPSDCVKLAINVLFGGDPRKIDFLVSGINHGSNAAVNIIYSGTMGACFTAAENGIPALGFSINSHDKDVDMQYLQPYLSSITKHLLDEYIPYGVCYNINAPVGEIRGIRFTRQCKGHWAKEIEEQQNEKGEKYYWLTGYFVNHEPQAEDTDQWAIENGYLSVQPCTIDMTAYNQL